VTVFANYASPPFRFRDEATLNPKVQLLEALPDRRPSLRDAAALVDARATVQLSLPLLWRELTRGLCKVVDGFFTQSRCLLLTTPSQKAVPLEGRRLHVLESILSGVCQKSVAIELKLAPSTVALNARLALESLGVRSKPSRVHPLLMLSATSARVMDPTATGALSYLGDEQASLRVISIARPDIPLESALPSAELAVIRSLVEGVTYAEIARRRGTSTRTIANQITAVFRRMKVSGRSELLLRLFLDASRRSSVLVPALTMAPPETNVLEVIAG
jgi:DNA-binding NarL/FixJ family response regulator